MQVQGSTFLVSGGSSGLGAACVRTLAGAGGNVLIADLNQAAGEALAAELGERARFVRTDVTDEASAQNAVEAAVKAFGGLQGAILCAGIGLADRVLSKSGPHNLASFAKVINVNLIGSFNLLRLAAAAMAKGTPNAGGERGVIVTTASVAAFDGQIGQLAYSASKGAVVGMTLPAARDLAVVGIRVMAIAPGLFDTPLLAMLPEEQRAELGRSVLFPQRLGQPAQFGQLVVQIARNSYLNGDVVRLDGGIRMPPK